MPNNMPKNAATQAEIGKASQKDTVKCTTVPLAPGYCSTSPKYSNGTQKSLHGGITWNAVSGRVYTVRHSGSLTGAFLPLPGAIALPWPASSVTDTVHAAESEGFYQLEVELP